MTRTMLRVVCLLFLVYGTLTAGAHNDYEVCAGNCEQRLEVASLQHSLDATICYETAFVCALKARHVEPIMAEVKLKLDFGDYDPRVEAIKNFFTKYKSPAAKYAKLFVQVADTNDLDWRLLPTFAFIESGGAKVHRNNNIFGWDSGRAKFSSIEDGIRSVGRYLTLGPYKTKTALQKIRVYNTHASYHRLADKVMKWINDSDIAVDKSQKSSTIITE
jgi:hypothetical protein